MTQLSLEPDVLLARLRSRSERTTQRTVAPPSAPGPLTAGGLLSVILNDDEDVEWIWTHYADGHSAVIGYRIVPRTMDRRLASLEQKR